MENKEVKNKSKVSTELKEYELTYLESDLYICEKTFHGARECKTWCGKCEMRGRVQ
tara:strand:+ start:2408 stop:2575 length:168 start_codon:yes stop_codon:yes gene_type:complete